MGIGRREFLRLTGLALMGSAFDPLKSVVINDNAYINKKLGILFYKPNNWGFIKIKDFGRLKAEQFMGTGLEESPEEIWEEIGDPVCIATKYFEDTDKNKGIFSPTITLNVTPKTELNELEHYSFEEIIELSHYGISQLLKDFKVIKTYKPYYISNCKFYETDSEYMFEHVDLVGQLKVELKSLTAIHNGFYYDFNFHQSISQNQTAHKEFDEFKKSIKLI